MRTDISSLIQLERGQNLKEIDLQKYAMIEGYDISPINILAHGDLIIVLENQQIQLMAPNLCTMDKTRTLQKKIDWVQSELISEWSFFLESIRSFFRNHHFIEAKTPLLVPCPGTEPSLDVFRTQLKIGSSIRQVYLPTSPELHLKKLLSFGADKIFELSPCFRNGESTEKHRPEFLMLEWYQSFSNLSIIKNDVINLISHLSNQLNLDYPKKILSWTLSDLFKIHCNFKLTPESSLSELKTLADQLRVDTASATSIDDFFYLIFTEKVEPFLNPEDLIFVEKYPPYQAALARLTHDGWGDRFEFYWKGFELGNAFHELNDPIQQIKRFEEDLSKKKIMGKESVPLDGEFMECLNFGMPPSSGIAVGVDRLFMALKNIQDIKKLSPFSFGGDEA